MRTTLVLLWLGLAGAAGAAWADDIMDIKPGLWEIVTEMKMPGMSMTMPAMTSHQCLTAQEIAKREKLLSHPPAENSNEKCETKDFVHKGNTVTWTMSCHGGRGDSRGRGKVVYDSATAYHGMIHITANIKGRSMDMTQHIRARRTGDCGS